MNGAPRVTSWLAACALICGCGDGDGLKREAVSGKVTYAGKPVEKGSIQFQPQDADQKAGAWGEIVDGAYSIAASTGPVAGDYTVAIYSASSQSAAADALPGDDAGMSDPRAIPDDYNVKSTLKATIEPAKPNELNYDLKPTSSARKGR
ncbi:hypothetical protein [Singulisphaera sp. PoT]|uniref:hypothetical protein n=1 Tax=Singulisphaera sp. PoT TaxID=3411797 RepID=UPI003BF5665C